MTSIHQRLFGKYQAALSFTRFARHIQNWPEVWGAYRSGGEIPSPLRLRNGLVLHFESADDPAQLFREIIVESVYTPAWFYCPKAGETIIDVGANIGFFATSLVWHYRGVQVHCFEPNPVACTKLKQNIAANSLDAQIKIHPFAVYKEETTVELNLGVSSLQSSLFAHSMASGVCTKTVAAISLRQALERCEVQTVDLLKVDAEGAEIDIFETADTEMMHGVKRVVVEFHDHFRPRARQTVSDALERSGFTQIRTDHVNEGATNGILYACRNS